MYQQQRGFLVTISILLLGTPQVMRDGQLLTVPRRQSRALLYYLAAQRGRVEREHLTDLFWPDLERAAARQTLRTTLHGLRQRVGEALEIDDIALAVRDTVDVDLRELEQQLGRSQPELATLDAVLARVRGELLEGFSLPDAPGFEQWAGNERERIGRQVVRGLTILARAFAGQRMFAPALDALERALLRDPLLEDVQRLAMQIAYFSGDRVGAIRRYEQLRMLLDEELGVPPMAETQLIYDAIVTDGLDSVILDQWQATLPPTAPVASAQPALGRSDLPFVGREIELERLRQAIAGGHMVLISGEPGIGKTRLAEEWLRSFSGQVLRGSAYEPDRAQPYQPIVDALRRVAREGYALLLFERDLAAVWRSELARLAPDLFAVVAGSPIPSPLPADELRMREAIGQLLRSLAKAQPCVLFIDDLQWADHATLGLVGYLVRQRLEGLTILATTQPLVPRTPAATLIQSMTREGWIEQIALTRLARAATYELVQQVIPHGVEVLGEWLERHAEGNPYVLSELIRHMARRRLLSDVRQLDLSDATLVIPDTVYALIEARLQALSDDARRILDTAVAIGRSFGYDLVARAAGLGDEVVLDAIDELLAAGLIRHSGSTSYEFDHSLTMEVAYRDIGEPRHLLLHRRVAEALEQIHRHSPAEVAGLIAMHYSEGGDAERAAPHAVIAGRRAAALGAWPEAIAFFQQGLAGSFGQAHTELLLEVGTAQLSAAAYASAAETLAEVIAAAEQSDQSAMLGQASLLLGQALLSQARFQDTIAIAERLVQRDGDVAARAEVLWGTALSLEGADLEEAAAHFRRAERSGRLAGDADSLAQIRFELGGIRAQQGQFDQAIVHYHEALAIAEHDGSERTIAWQVLAHNNLGYHLHLLGDPAARHHAERGLLIARERGVIGLETYLYSTLGEIALAAGQFDEAEAAFRAGLLLAEQLVVPERIAGLTANLGRVDAARGLHDLAIHRLSLALARADAIGTRHLAAQIRIWLAPLLPLAAARETIADARMIAVASGRRRLIEEITRVEIELNRRA